MTADRPPGEPATEAGRDFLYDYQAFGPPSVRQFTDGILAIEAEARASAPLDMERLTRALWSSVDEAHAWLSGEGTSHDFASWIAAEYARLTAEGEQK